MRRAAWILKTLASHWRRHPILLVTFIVGLMSATALWSGVQAINMHARASYDRAAAAFGSGGRPMLLPAQGEDVPQALFARLRRAGWLVSPIVEGRIRLGQRQVRLIGIEPISLPQGSGPAPDMPGDTLRAFLSAEGRTLVAPETAHDLGLRDGDRPRAESGATLPPVQVTAIVPDVLVVDIGFAQRILDKPGRISRFLLDPANAATSLEALAGDELRLEAAAEASDLQRMTASFHLNLTAFGLLSFLVGLFIAHAAVGLACEQRLPAIRTLRACGAAMGELCAVWIAELLLLALLSGLLGLLGGYIIARLLLPDVAASLRGLYGASVSSQLLVSPQWWFTGLAMSVAGALAAAAQAAIRILRLPILAAAQQIAWQQAQQRWLRRQIVLAAAALLAALASFWFGVDVVAGFAVLGGIMVAAALALPSILDAMLRLGQSMTRRPLLSWLWADSRQQLSGLSLALMALLLALAVNVGVATMVGSFSDAFLHWLDGRLLADVYVAARNNDEADQIRRWLQARSEVNAVLSSARAQVRLQNEPVELVGLPDHALYRAQWPLLQATSAAWARLRDGQGVMVSEQLSRRLGLTLGSSLTIPLPSGGWKVAVVAIYADYGNPKGQLSLGDAQLTARSPQADRTRLGLLVAPSASPRLMAALHDAFGLSGRNLSDQATVKAEARRVFSRTFAVTAALNGFTLLVAGIALLTSLLALGDARLAHLAPLWAMGVASRSLAALEFAKTLMLALLTSLLALPLGLVVAWCLIAVINVKAFGWRLPFLLSAGDLVNLVLVALLAAAVAAAVPVVKLARMRPARLLRIFADER